MAAPPDDIADAMRGVVALLIPIISDFTVSVLRKSERRRARVWIRSWIRRRSQLGVSDTLLRELAVEDRAKYKEWELVKRKFEVQWNFPNCVEAIDGKHIQIKCPPKSGSNYYNYKGTFSITLFALVDAEYNFLYIDVGANGKSNDGAVFQASTLNIAMESNSLNLLQNTILVAVDAFPLRKDILKPFSKRNLSISERIYRLSRARRVSENAFGILVAKFRVFERPIALSPETVDLVVKSSCALHNWLRK
ncbi:uncharacterized protein LOC130452155 [Diorhabda sublineata]|uniref:uncharacterized protein LOC130452155 n=1 Tax=Diorhabda sublineata TaxID=1163346 RepID=UPI0024E1955A|nr:uncharacterized protein LOC130452155 [Diorhabda sublineata]